MDSIRDFALRMSEVAQSGNLQRLAEFYTADATLWFNTSGETRTIQEHIARAGESRKSRRNVVYADIRITPFEGGYLQQWRAQSEDDAGARRDMPVCMVCHLKDGKIHRREEYFDSAHLRG